MNTGMVPRRSDDPKPFRLYMNTLSSLDESKVNSTQLDQLDIGDEDITVRDVKDQKPPRPSVPKSVSSTER